MITSQKTSVASQIEGDDELSKGTLAYLGERSRNAIYSFVLGRFLEEEQRGLTRAKLARRLGKKPELVTRLLGAPGNWTIDTIAELLAGISREEIDPAARSLVRSNCRNVTTLDLINSGTKPEFQWINGSEVVDNKPQELHVYGSAATLDRKVIFHQAAV